MNCGALSNARVPNRNILTIVDEIKEMEEEGRLVPREDEKEGKEAVFMPLA
jgi:hypothetical protein